LLIKEWQAHDDCIVDISQIKDPSSFMTCSKDKRVKIWTYQGECIGEINTGSFLTSNSTLPSSPWQFKLNWEKLKLEEITEVMRIYQNVSGSNMIINDKFNPMLDDQTDDNFDDRKKQKKEKQEVQIVRKKRFKPLEETKKDKIFVNYNDDADVKFDVNNLFFLFI
jgi:hypothetical protein